MWFFVGGPIVTAVGLAAWPAVESFRIGRWGQGVLILALSVLAPFIGLIIAVMAMSDALYRSGMPFGVIPVVVLICWIAAIVTPIALGVALHLMGRFTPPPPASPSPHWRPPE